MFRTSRLIRSTRSTSSIRLLAVAFATVLTLVPRAVLAGPLGYVQTNLASDIPGLAAFTDPNLKNPWGMSFTATSPFWISDQVTNVATLYSGTGAPNALVVSIPPPPPPPVGPAGPTGQVANGTTDFTLSPGNPARFIFATLQGTVTGWNPAVSATTALTEYTATDGAIYTGLALANNGTANFLYAADTRNGKIDVLNGSFQKVTLGGNFVDPSVPSGFTPYNIQTVGGLLYVEYASRTLPGGFIGVFDLNGNFLRHSSDPHLNAPWGITLAPAGFGDFGGALLIGNFGDGMINAFNPTTLGFLGVIMDTNGNPIINTGLWALNFRVGGPSVNTNALYFVAGINNEQDGLFGSITPAAVPEPATLTMLGMGIGALASRRMRRGKRAQRG